MAIYWTQVSTASIIVATRLYTRKRMKIIGIDDWLMLITLVRLRSSRVTATSLHDSGVVHHPSCSFDMAVKTWRIPPLSDVPVQRLSKVALLNYVMQAAGIFSFATAKASVGCLILRFLGPKGSWRRWLIWRVMILTFVLNSVNCILTLAQCSPPRALWDHSIKAHCSQVLEMPACA